MSMNIKCTRFLDDSNEGPVVVLADADLFSEWASDQAFHNHDGVDLDDLAARDCEPYHRERLPSVVLEASSPVPRACRVDGSKTSLRFRLLRALNVDGVQPYARRNASVK